MSECQQVCLSLSQAEAYPVMLLNGITSAEPCQKAAPPAASLAGASTKQADLRSSAEDEGVKGN